MADELDPVEQRFIADMADYLERLQSAIDEAKRFAEANIEAKAGVDELRDGAEEAGHALDDLFRHSDEVIAADNRVRDSAAEEAMALGHLRDEAILAGAALHEMDDASRSHLDSLRGGLDGVTKAAEDAAGAIDGGAGGAGGVGGLAGSLLTGSFSMGLLIAPAAFLAAVLAGPMVAGLFAVTASIGSLGLVAIPTFKDISAFFTATSSSARKAAWKSMDPAEQGITKSLQDLMHTFDGIAKAVQPSLMQMFGDGLKVIKALLPSVKPLAEAAAKAFGGFFDQIAGWLNGPSGQKFLHWLDTSAPGAMHDFTQVLWDTMNVVGRVFDFLRNAGDAWYKHFSQGAHQISEAIDVMRGAIEDFAHNTAAHFDELRHDIAGWAHDTANDFDDVRHDAAEFGHDVAATFDDVRHTIASWGAAVASTFDDVRHAAADLAHNIASYFDEARANIARWAADVGSDAAKVVSWFAQLPGKIMSALGNLASDLFHIGVSAIEGLINGITSMVGAVVSKVSSIASDISGALAGVLHILSPSRVFFQHGVDTFQGYIDGVESMRGRVRAAVASIASSVLPAAGGGGYSGGRGGTAAVGGGAVNVTVPVTASAVASPEFLHGLQQVVQEAILRYANLNQGNGVFLPGKLS